jgi:hypothetical protein
MKRWSKMKEVMGTEYVPNNADLEFEKLANFILNYGMAHSCTDLVSPAYL